VPRAAANSTRSARRLHDPHEHGLAVDRQQPLERGSAAAEQARPSSHRRGETARRPDLDPDLGSSAADQMDVDEERVRGDDLADRAALAPPARPRRAARRVHDRHGRGAGHEAGGRQRGGRRAASGRAGSTARDPATTGRPSTISPSSSST
jgi:hypothetical protein